MQPASLHMCGSDCHFDQEPKNDATTVAVSSPAPFVHPTNTVQELWRRGRGSRLMSLDWLVDWVQSFLFSTTIVITWTSS